ncbi:aldo/keto reductase [Cohnella thailandensis]|uniref:Aldo/keto reductase n=1 Tax=Cohnella thailandensis TaxID=557557 RepID=A0A841ST87_9BACL|nr:aldo/keto reductase [Cohnella thailandensis]MBB6633255.1 aldo/keto reductase [Cohnella thailandensis]MBP1975047.1 aryl-alcohol dehydrogenase-like predicted oxidoreductase [Cohnella thailandensis]
MKKNRLGKSDLFVGEIGLGCMSLGTEEAKATSIIHEALERGVTLLDTADLYDGGRNEELVGKAIKGRRGDVVLATKVGNRRIPGQDGWVWDPSKEYILSAVKESLQRLGTDYIDLYQLHGGTIDDPIDETIEAFEQLKRVGVIREYGISSIRPNVIREYASRSSIVSVMNPYSIVDRRAEEAVLPLLEEKGISVIARGPLASGALAANRKPAKGVTDYELAELEALRGRLERLTFDDRNLTRLALRYPLAHPAVAAVIPGASSREQLLQNLAAAEVPALTDEELRTIRSFSKANKYAQHR